MTARDIYQVLDKYQQETQDLIKNNPRIIDENKKHILEFLDWKERRLKNEKGREHHDKLRWHKTMHFYVLRLRNVGEWIQKPFDQLTKEDIQKFYDDFEDGRITKANGQPYKSKKDYYSKVFKSEFMKRINPQVHKHYVEIMRQRKDETPVRYFPKITLDNMLTHTTKVSNRALLLLLFDTGERVRLICINTPETDEVGYIEATQKLTDLLLGKYVRLEKDVSERDKYARLLRYVYLDSVFVNELMVRKGFAKVARYPPDTKHCDVFDSAEALAREEQIGLWSPRISDVVVQDVSGPGVVCSSNYYNCDDFSTREEALAVLRACGTDIHRLDGDHDGVPCENLP